MKYAHMLPCTMLLAVMASARAESPLEIRGAIESVTVYRGQALVTRVVDVPPPGGLREIVVTDLPEHVVPGSIYAESNDSAEIRSVRYRVRPVSADVREDVRKIDEQLVQIGDAIQVATRRVALLAETKAYVDKLEQFVAPTASAELTRGVLNAETLKTLTMFILEQRRTIADDELKLAVEQRALNEKKQLLERERQVLSGTVARTIREALVFLNLPKAEGGKIRVRYLVDQASWTPSYNVRASGDRSGVLVEYYASIQQMSGEDWSDVSMTLSTATPSLVARSPVLLPLTLTLARPAQEAGEQQARKSASREQIFQQQKEVEQARAKVLYIAPADGLEKAEADKLQADMGLKIDFDAQLNSLANDLQLLDMTARGRVSKAARDEAPSGECLSVTYQLATRATLPSRADQQLVQIAALPLKGEIYRVATPVLTTYVYEEARLTNASQTVMLAGPVSTYVDGQFVGHGQIPTVAAGEAFTVGLGIDASLRASRELIDRSETIQGGNRVVDFTYRLVIENFGGGPVALRVLDRLPKARESDVKLTLVSDEALLSGDSEYVRTDRKKGILRWDVDVDAEARGAKAHEVTYKFRVEYDKGMTIDGLPVAAVP
ncbi:MAG: hypothetical protein CHACPFDD_00821 [Phycisphaerae bacterium]|nr:hypothetical protein [Phycisphaerae bacterium]